MKKVILIILALTGLLFGFSLIQKEKQQSQKTVFEIEKKYKNNRDLPPVDGSYEVFELSKISLAKERRVVLFFNASWCPSCNKLEDEIKQIVLPNNVLLLSVDYDRYQELLRKYEIAYQHTFVEVDEFGNPLHKWSGGGIEKLKKELGLYE